MNIRNLIATNNSIFTVPIKYLFYKYQNKYYKVNELIQNTEIIGDKIYIKLKNGLIISDNTSNIDAEIQFTDRIKFGNPARLTNIKNVNKYFFIYEIISELFVNTFHFKYYNLKEGDVVIDAGANIGGFTIQAAKLVGNKGKVIAIEPNSKNMEVLQRNCELNKLSNVIFIDKGLWSQRETLEFFESHRPGEHSLIHNDEQHEKFTKKSVKLEVDSLDNILKTLNIKEVNFVKMDIEGAEYEALLGAKNSLLSLKHTNLAIEIHLDNDGPTDIKIIPLLKESNFEILESGSSYRMPVFAKKG